jgi:hypothetical protein
LADLSIPSYPAELLWNGRLPDQDFQPHELLFYRAKELNERGKLGSVDVILCPNTSVSREKYSKPIYVLYAQLPKFLGWHVLEFCVRDIPPELSHPDATIKRRFQFQIVHVPVKPPDVPDENYAHSEIQASENQQTKKRLPGLVEKQFRQMLADRMERVPLERLQP